MVSIDEDIDVDAIEAEASGGIDIGGGQDPGDITVNVGDGDDGGGGGDGGGGNGIATDVTEDIEDLPSGDDGGGDDGGGVDIGPGEDVSTIDDGGPGGGGTGGGTQPPTAPDPGDVQTQPIIDEARNEQLADDLRDMAGGGGQAGDLSSADVEQMERDIIAQRIRENTGGGGRASRLSSQDVTPTRAMGGPRPGDITVEPGGGIERRFPNMREGPPETGQGLEVKTAGEDAPVYTIDDPRPNRGTFTGTKPEIARLIESISLEGNRGLAPTDIAVVETGSGLAVRQTFGGLQKQWLVGSLARDIGQQFRSDAATTARISNLGAIRTAVEQEVEGRRNVWRVGVSGGESPGDLRVDITGEPADVDLSMRPWGAQGPLQVTGGPRAGDVRAGFGTPEGDFTVSPVFGEPGRFDIGLTEPRIREEVAFGFEQQLARTGPTVELNRSDIVLTEDGPQLTQAASGRVETRFLTSTVEDIEGAFAEAHPGEPSRGIASGPLVPEKGDTDRLSATYELAPGVTTEPYLAATSDFFGGLQEFVSGEYSSFLEETFVEPDPDPDKRELGFIPSTRETKSYAVGGLSGIVMLAQSGAELPAHALNLSAAADEAIYKSEDPQAAIEFTEQLSTQAQRLPAVAASGLIGQAATDPARFTGTVAGSLAASGVAMRALPASRWAIQPGEEILGRGGFAVTRRVAGARTAQRLFPNKEPLIFSEEAAIRGISAAGRGLGRGVRTANIELRSGADRVRSGAGSTLTEAQLRTPSFGFEVDPEARLLEIDPAVGRQLREAAIGRPRRRVRSAAETVREAPRTAFEAGRTGVGRVREGGISAAETVVEVPSRLTAAPGELRLGYEAGRFDEFDVGPDPSVPFEVGRRGGLSVRRQGRRADAAAYRAGRRVGEGIGRVEELPEAFSREVLDAPREFGLGFESAGSGELTVGPAPTFAFRAGRRSGLFAGRQGSRLDAAAYRAGRRVGEGIGRVEAFPEAFGQRLTATELRLEDLGIRTKESIRSEIDWFLSLDSNLIGRLESGAGRVRTGAGEFAGDVAVRTRSSVESGIETIEATPGLIAETGERGVQAARGSIEAGGELAGRGIARAEGAAETLIEVPGQARAAPREAAFGFALGSRRVGVSDIGRFEASPGQLEEGRAFEFGFELGETEAAAREDISAQLSAFRAGLETRAEQLASLRDLTIRVEPGLPRRPTVSGSDLEVGDFDSLAAELESLGIELDFELESETDTDTGTEGDVDSDRPVAGGAGETGVVVERARAEFETESAARAEGRAEAAGRRLETTAPTFAQDAAAVGLGEGTLAQFDVRTEQRPEVESFTDLRLEARPLGEVESRAGREVRQEVRTGFDTDLELAELEQRREIETLIEAEGEFEFDLEIEGENERDRASTTTADMGGNGGESVIGRAFGPGWLNQFAVALAGGGLAARQAPENIEELAAERGTFLGLPTAGQVDPDEELAAGLEAVDELFFRDGGNTEAATETGDDLSAWLDFGGAEAGGDTDEDPWGLL